MILRGGLFGDVLAQALYSLRENLLRTALSILGIAVGIGAVMTVGTVTQSVRHYVYAELETYGLQTIWVYRHWEDNNPFRAVREGSGIDNDDFRALHGGCCPAIVRATPVVFSDERKVLARVGSHYDNANLEGVGVEYLSINRDSLMSGRAFAREDVDRHKPVALIGTKVRDELFGKNANPIGATLRIWDQRFTVIGMLNDKKRDLLEQIGAENYDINRRILIPYTVFQQQLGSKEIHTLQVEAASQQQIGEALTQVTELLERRYGERYTYDTEDMLGWIGTADALLRNISLVGLVGAAVALIVGGLGIMNIMGTSVVERTREIGIRKAIGAYDKDILMQFLLESTVVSLIGGVIGLVLGIAVALSIGWWTGYAVTPSWGVAAVAIFVSFVVGVVSGYYPAYRAANMLPVDALRYD